MLVSPISSGTGLRFKIELSVTPQFQKISGLAYLPILQMRNICQLFKNREQKQIYFFIVLIFFLEYLRHNH